MCKHGCFYQVIVTVQIVPIIVSTRLKPSTEGLCNIVDALSPLTVISRQCEKLLINVKQVRNQV